MSENDGYLGGLASLAGMLVYLELITEIL